MLLTLMLVAAAFIGAAVLVGSLVVLHALDLRRHRWLPAICWATLAAAGGWLLLMPLVHHRPPPWPVLVLGLTVAWVVWRDLHRWPDRAAATSSPSTRDAGRA